MFFSKIFGTENGAAQISVEIIDNPAAAGWAIRFGDQSKLNNVWEASPNWDVRPNLSS
jgi:hypothetical protein